MIALTCRAYVVFASFAGPTGDVFTDTAGCSAVWSPKGLALTCAAGHVDRSVRATLG